ncbi:MAG: RNA polymerase sigma factor [Terriglobia bacterium]
MRLDCGLSLFPPSTLAAGDSLERESLVSAARSGDRLAFGRLYGFYARMVRGILLGLVPRGEVDDLTQDVFLQAMRRLKSLREPGSFGGWLAMIARNRAKDYYRGAVASSEVSDELATADPPLAEAISVLKVIRNLPEAYRETLILRFVEGMTGPEIAELTGMTPGSVRVNLHRGMKLLREQLSAEDSR